MMKTATGRGRGGEVNLAFEIRQEEQQQNQVLEE